MFTGRVLKPLKNTFYNERFVQAIKSLMQINAAICRIQSWQRQLIERKSKKPGNFIRVENRRLSALKSHRK
jgi:hypothetical protein